MVIYLLVTQFLTLSEEQDFLLDSIVDLLLTQKLTNLKVLQLQSDYFHDKVIICSSNSLIQMNSVIKKIKKDLKISEFIYEGENSNWLLVSLKGILIQIFTEESREYYNIEDIYFDSETLYQFGSKKIRGCSSAGRAPAWHAGGQGFKSPQLHLINEFSIYKKSN